MGEVSGGIVPGYMPGGIVLGYDGSPGSETALRWAAREARARGTELRMCLAFAPEGLDLLIEPSVYGLAQKKGKEILAEGVRHAEAMLGPGRTRSVLVSGSAAPMLCEFSRTVGMVVVGSRGRGELAGLLLGSVSRRVAGYAQGPVVVVRGEWQRANDGARPVAVGVDGSPGAQAALAFAFEEAALHRVPLLAVCALADAPASLGAAHRMEEDFAHLMETQEKEHPEVPVLREVPNGSPRSALLAAADGAQLLVVGSRGLAGLAGMRLGSVAEAVLHHAPCPVAVVHSPKDRD